MARLHLNHPYRPSSNIPTTGEPGAPPVEPDEGPIQPGIPDDPEQDRTNSPAASQSAPARRGDSRGRLALRQP